MEKWQAERLRRSNVNLGICGMSEPNVVIVCTGVGITWCTLITSRLFDVDATMPL